MKICKSKYNRSIHRLIISVFLFQTWASTSAQTFTTSTTNTSFTVNTSSQVESSSTIASSFDFNVTSFNRTYDVLAYISSKSFNPSSTEFSSLPLSVRFRSVSGISTSSGVVAGDIPLQENPPGTSTLITNAPRTNNATAVWTFDLILSPIGYTIPPGSYVFTLTLQYSDSRSTITRTFTISLTVQPVATFSLTQNASTTVPFTSSAAYTNGITLAGFSTVGIKANVPWLVTLASQAAFFTPGGGGASSNMPCSVLSFKPSSNTTYTLVSTTAQSLQSGLRGDAATSGNTVAVDMKFTPGYQYNPGIYNLSLVYTLTSQ